MARMGRAYEKTFVNGRDGYRNGSHSGTVRHHPDAPAYHDGCEGDGVEHRRTTAGDGAADGQNRVAKESPGQV